MLTKRITELLEATQSFCPGGSKQLTVRNQTGKLFGEFYLQDSCKRNELEEVLSKFDDLLHGYTISERLVGGEIWSTLAHANFEVLQHLAEQDLDRVFREAKDSQGSDPAYSLSIWLDPAQGGWTYLLRCQNGFESALSKKQNGEYARFYSTEEQIAHFKYYGYSTISFDTSPELSLHLGKTADSGYSSYDKYGERFLRQHSAHHFELTTDSAARALVNSVHSAKSTLLTSDDFIMYLQYSDEDEISHYRAARRTLGADSVQKHMSALYSDLIGK